MNFRKTLIAGSAAAAVSLLAGAASADTLPACSDTTMVGPNPIYLSGSSAFEPTAALMAVKLGALTGADQVTLVYSATSSCDGPTNIRDNKALTGNADYWTLDPTDATKPPVKHSCTLDTGTKADVGVSDIFYENCPGNDPVIPAGLVDTKGPVQAMIFIVPESNVSQTNLTAAEGQDIWGCGMAGMVTPFTDGTTPNADPTMDNQSTQQRSAGSGTQGIVAKAINVPPGSFKGKNNAAGGDLVTSLMKAPHQDQAIGFLAADAYDTRRSILNALAFQAFNQTRAYYADSTPDAFDKRNVRNGHYTVWGPEHFFAAADNTGKITNMKAANFIGWVNGTTTTAAFKYIDIEATANVIPQCAMKVTRDTDGGFLKPYTPAAPCGCYWESIATKTAMPAGCTPCTSNAQCTTAGQTCSNNFCE
jgi:ABC-type phosphate transport system substrate-binding protein